LICRYDNGQVTHNIEATQAGYGGFKSDPDEYLIRQYHLPSAAIASGSDLRAVTPREMLGIFVGLRARHMWDTGAVAEAEKDYLLARYLFPVNRYLYGQMMVATLLKSKTLFEPDEEGSPVSLANWIEQERFARDHTGHSPALTPDVTEITFGVH
jgi:hypothetical protein